MKKFRCANKGFILSSLKARNLGGNLFKRMAGGQKLCIIIHFISFLYFLRSRNIFIQISSKDLPVVCFVVTQHSESALSLCLRYSKTSCRRQPKYSIFY